jgi:hypothetical protein
MPTQEGILAVLSSIYPFRAMDDEFRLVVANNVREEHYDAGEIIYRVGDPAHDLFILYSGNVRLYLPAEVEGDVLATHKQGDFFGHEVLEERGVRRTTARAINDVTVLAFDEPHLVFLAENLPDIAEAFELMSDSFNLIMRLRFPWLGENEAVYYLARRHPMFLIERLIALLLLFGMATVSLLWFLSTPPGNLVLPLIGFGLVFLVLFVAIIWVIVDWSNDYSIITSQRVLFQELIVFLYDSRREAPLSAILSVTTETSLLGRILDYGDVMVRTFTGLITLPFVRKPDHVGRIVEAEWYRARVSLTRAERAAVEHRIREIVGLPSTAPVPLPVPAGIPILEDEEEAAPDRQNWFTRIFAELFFLRFERGGDIIYRKHWWILLRHIFLPSLAILTLFFFTGYLLWIPGALLSPVIGWLTLAILFPVLFGWWIYQYVDWRNDFFMVTDEQILDVYRKPLAREERRAAPLRSIQSIEFERLGLIGILLNFGTVYIRVGDTQLTFDEVFNPSEVQRELFNRLATREYRDRLAEQQREQDRMSQWLSTYHRLTNPEVNPDTPPEDEQI